MHSQFREMYRKPLKADTPAVVHAGSARNLRAEPALRLTGPYPLTIASAVDRLELAGRSRDFLVGEMVSGMGRRHQTRELLQGVVKAPPTHVLVAGLDDHVEEQPAKPRPSATGLRAS